MRPTRRTRLVVTGIVALSCGASLAGCESCSFGYGPGAATVRVLADVAPTDLRVQVCDRTDDTAATACNDATESPGDGGMLVYTGRVSIEGTFSCGTGPFVVRATASNCDTAAVVVSGSGEFRRDVSVTLRCR